MREYGCPFCGKIGCDGRRCADVPLICDPVPGPPGVITTSQALTPEQVEQLKQAWRKAFTGLHYARPVVVTENVRFGPTIGQRTEWPDAEFCAA